MKGIKKSVAIVLILAMLLTVAFTGCGGSEGAAEQPAAAKNVCYMALQDPPMMDWDPSVAFSTEILVLVNMYETLLRYESESDTFTPVLATEYDKSEDGLTWTFKIREGVTFHDGSVMDAHDVAYSLLRSKNINKGGSFIWAPVDTITATDDYTVEITLLYEAALDLIVACGNSAFIMNEELAEQGTDWFQQGNECGTGPYKLRSQSPGDEVIIEAYEGYWGGWEDDQYDTVVIKYVSENASRRQMIESGEADITKAIMIDDLVAMESNPNLTIFNKESFTNTVGFWNTQNPPFDNVLVRKALNYSFPYDDMLDYVFQGYVTRATGPVPVGMWGALEEPTYVYDIEKAKELLAEAGYPDGGFTMKLAYISSSEDRKKIAELWKAELETLGINVELVAMPWDQLWEKAKSPKPEDRVDWLSITWWPDVVTPSSWFTALYVTEETISFNLGYYSNPELDRIVEEAAIYSATDRDYAAELYRQAGQIVTDDAVSTFLVDTAATYVISNDLGNFDAKPAYPSALFFYDFVKKN